jgi:hypothetical protein
MLHTHTNTLDKTPAAQLRDAPINELIEWIATKPMKTQKGLFNFLRQAPQ